MFVYICGMIQATKIIDIMNSKDPVSEILSNRDLFPFIDECMIGYGRSKWHSEGDVWRHTELAISAVFHMDHDWMDILIALLHDIGKKSAFEFNEGKNMIGHDAVGAKMAADWMKTNGFDNDEIEIVKYVISMHMRVKKLAEMTSEYDVMDIVTHPYFGRLKILGYADCEATLGPDMKPSSDFNDVLNAKYVSKWEGRCRPLPVVRTVDLAEAGIPYAMYAEAKERTLKQQINGGLTRSESLIKSIVNDPVFRSKIEEKRKKDRQFIEDLKNYTESITKRNPKTKG